MTLALTQHDTTQPNTLLRRPVAALDVGNRTTQWVTSTGQVMTIPSVIKKLEPWEEAEFDDESVLVEVIDFDGNKIERFVIGAEAQVQKGTLAFEVNKV